MENFKSWKPGDPLFTPEEIEASHSNEIAHLIDEIETLKGNVTREINEALYLLDNGMIAAWNGKNNVLVDHADRARDHLRALRKVIAPNYAGSRVR